MAGGGLRRPWAPTGCCLAASVQGCEFMGGLLCDLGEGADPLWAAAFPSLMTSRMSGAPGLSASPRGRRGGPRGRV